jgi:hypothetical protein
VRKPTPSVKDLSCKRTRREFWQAEKRSSGELEAMWLDLLVDLEKARRTFSCSASVHLVGILV